GRLTHVRAVDVDLAERTGVDREGALDAAAGGGTTGARCLGRSLRRDGLARAVAPDSAPPAGTRTVSRMRTVSTATPAGGSAPRSSARYPPTPATATTTTPITSPARERLGRILAPVAGSGVVGAP